MVNSSGLVGPIKNFELGMSHYNSKYVEKGYAGKIGVLALSKLTYWNYYYPYQASIMLNVYYNNNTSIHLRWKRSREDERNVERDKARLIKGWRCWMLHGCVLGQKIDVVN